MPSVHKWKSLDAWIFLIAGCLLAAIPVANHLLLRTYALDLGFYNHALFEYRQLRLADSDMLLALVQLSGILAVNAMNATQTVVYNEKTRLRIFQREHYRQHALDVDEVRRYISKQIPQDASVSAASPLVPHLAFREDIYEFPLLKDAQHMILLPGISVYPVDPNCFDALMEEIRATGQWKLMHEGPGWSHYMKQ